MKKQSLKLMSIFLLLTLVLVGCGQAATPAETPAAAPVAPAESEATANQMQYVSPDKGILE